MTLSELRTWLAELAAAEATLPARVVLERLPADVQQAPGDACAADLTAEEAGALLHRSPSTVRAYAREGLLEGAYHQRGREWRVPRAAIAAFQRAEAERERSAQQQPEKPAPRAAGPVDLSAWRKERAS